MDQQLAHCLLLVSVISSASFYHVTASPAPTDDSPSIQRLDLDDERDLLETGSDVRDDDGDGDDVLRRLITSSIPHREPGQQSGEGETWKRVNEKSQSDSAPAGGGNRGKILLGRSWLTSRRTQSGDVNPAVSSSSSSSSGGAGGADSNQYNAGRQFKLGKKSEDFDQMTANKRKTIKFG